MVKSDIKIKDPLDFEKVVALSFKRKGYEIIMPPTNTKGYDIELRKDDKCIAVQVKNHKAKCNTSQVKKFQHFLEQPDASKFTEGWFISANGYSKPAITDIKAEEPEDLRLGIFIADRDRVSWTYGNPESISSKEPELEPKPKPESKYIGVFTCKGGVGKTTVAAHLAGAFALMGHDVILLDLDPERNLRKLFSQDIDDEDASVFVPPINKNEMGTTITVLNHDEWNPEDYPDIKITICDCSPVLDKNPKSLVEKFDYCVIPTTLNPLGVSKNCDVIIRTFKHIRQLNSHAEMFALINNYHSNQNFVKKNQVLREHLKRSLSKYTSTDHKCKFIDPDAAKIRYSTSLLYWGYHIVEGTKPQLAFNSHGGKSYPRTDFLQLAEYLEEHTTIDELRQQGH
ncbi:MAG: restriction endonuclease [Xenococcaceae cyanobacterium MO_188.B29]|nr:restriction endonuclease [Xenococcaceae cyanobacterium MO_188.B29]